MVKIKRTHMIPLFLVHVFSLLLHSLLHFLFLSPEEEQHNHSLTIWFPPPSNTFHSHQSPNSDLLSPHHHYHLNLLFFPIRSTIKPLNLFHNRCNFLDNHRAGVLLPFNACSQRRRSSGRSCNIQRP